LKDAQEQPPTIAYMASAPALAAPVSLQRLDSTQ
jgi:hypothetical protein